MKPTYDWQDYLLGLNCGLKIALSQADRENIIKNINREIEIIENSIDKQIPRAEKLSLLIGTMIGQISELLNSIQQSALTDDSIYRSLFDIHRSAGLQIHELFYKNNKP